MESFVSIANNWLKDAVDFRNFSRTGKIVFLREKSILQGSKNFLEEQGKFNFARKALVTNKIPAKISAKTLILWELLCLYFKRKNNNIKRKIFRTEQIIMERHSKGEFHVSVKGLKLWSRVPPQIVSHNSWELAKPSACVTTKNSLHREAIVSLLLVIQEV